MTEREREIARIQKDWLCSYEKARAIYDAQGRAEEGTMSMFDEATGKEIPLFDPVTVGSVTPPPESTCLRCGGPAIAHVFQRATAGADPKELVATCPAPNAERAIKAARAEARRVEVAKASRDSYDEYSSLRARARSPLAPPTAPEYPPNYIREIGNFLRGSKPPILAEDARKAIEEQVRELEAERVEAARRAKDNEIQETLRRMAEPIWKTPPSDPIERNERLKRQQQAQAEQQAMRQAYRQEYGVDVRYAGISREAAPREPEPATPIVREAKPRVYGDDF